MGFVQYVNRPAPFEAIPTWLFKDGQAGGFWIPRPLVRGRNQLYQDATGTALAAPGDPVGLMRDITPNASHLSQSVSGSRPVLVREPEGGRRNLLTWTDRLGPEGWGAFEIESGSVTWGDGHAKVVRGLEDIGIRGGLNALPAPNWSRGNAGQSYVISADMKADGSRYGLIVNHNRGGYVGFGVFDLQEGVLHRTGFHPTPFDSVDGFIEELGDGWYRCSLACRRHDISSVAHVNFSGSLEGDSYTGDGQAGVLVRRAQLEYGTEPTPYQRVTNNHDTFEQGKTHHTYLKLDKVDDNLSVSLPDAVNGTMLLATRDGIVHADVDIPAGEWSITADPRYYPGDTLVGLILRDGHMNEQELAAARDYLISIGAGADQFAGVESMIRWFNDRDDITALHVADWNTSNVKNFSNFLYGADNIEHFDPSMWDTSNADNVDSFIRSAKGLKTIDISGWDLSKVTTYGRYFASSASALETVVLGPNGEPFSTTQYTNYTGAFINTNLSQQSIDDILVAIEKAGTSNGTFDQSGGSAPSAVGEAAIDALRARGWTVTVTGGY